MLAHVCRKVSHINVIARGNQYLYFATSRVVFTSIQLCNANSCYHELCKTLIVAIVDAYDVTYYLTLIAVAILSGIRVQQLS